MPKRDLDGNDIDNRLRGGPAPRLKRLRLGAIFLLSLLPATGMLTASAQQLAPIGGSAAPTFTATLSNNTPLAFGMDADDTARALGMPLNYISGRPGEEVYLVFRNIGGSGFFNRRDRLYLQFRHGRLAGWKGDWGHGWMWQ